MKQALLQHTKAFHTVSILKLNHENDFQANLILNTGIRNISV